MSQFPEYINVRDTELHDEITGRRIFTTSGTGYPTQEFVNMESLWAWATMAGGLKCPTCDDTGSIPSEAKGTMPQGDQCQFCYEVPISKFHMRNL